MRIPKKTQDRLAAGLRKYQKIVRKLAERDISEADTVTVVKDILCDVFGYDKYEELTSEQQIRGTFCDLAIQVDGKVHYLAEVKSAGTTLAENHLRQAVNYGAHEGIEWVILTNAIDWKVYRISFGKPVNWEEVCSFNMGAITLRSKEDQEKLAILCRENIASEALESFHKKAQILNRYVIAELLQTDSVVGLVRREIKKLFDGTKVTDEQLRIILTNGVIKRDALDGDEPKAAKAKVKKATNSLARKAAKKVQS
ncbi:type I restriction enzyme HsdR N-terminal domain-containing protein [Erythrobacter sp. W53]|uniref:type I restriction enzyme HsdR N-terminal domain-containing protein n=1 Tax=Erythrobacter sp. W53 TaxID=3425947 RepID=UPI003D769033